MLSVSSLICYPINLTDGTNGLNTPMMPLSSDIFNRLGISMAPHLRSTEAIAPISPCCSRMEMWSVSSGRGLSDEGWLARDGSRS
jgi:hypothetical protein